jgi:hypothetical protein
MLFLANLLQNPGRKSMWGILIQSTPGSGKGLLAEIMESILGQSNCLTNVSFEDLVQKHSTLLKGRQFIVINELMLTGRRVEGKELANKLKPYFTDPVHIINPKFKEEILCPNFVNLFLYSNDPKPLHVDKDDRRICAIRVNHTKDVIVNKIESYVPYLKDLVKNPSSIKHYLINLELPDERFFGGHAPMTEAKQELIQSSKDEFEDILDEAFHNHSFPFTHKTWEVGKEKQISYSYRGYVVVDDLMTVINYDKLFHGVFKSIDMLTRWIKKNSIPWANGKMNREIFFPDSREKRRAWLLEDMEKLPGKKRLSEWTGAEIGKDFVHHRFRPSDDQSNSFNWSFINREENINQSSNDLFRGEDEK